MDWYDGLDISRHQYLNEQRRQRDLIYILLWFFNHYADKVPINILYDVSNTQTHLPVKLA